MQSKVVIHHTGSYAKDNSRQLASVDRSHKERFHFKSSLGYYVGYHFFIERSGAFTQTRSVKERGAHAYNERTGKSYNDYIGICLAGDFTNQQPSAEQIATLQGILQQLEMKREDVFLHRDLDDTACPGGGLTHETIDKLYEPKQVSEWAQSSVDKAIAKDIATDWSNPQELVANATAEWILHKAGIFGEVTGEGITKERFIVALDRLGGL